MFDRSSSIQIGDVESTKELFASQSSRVDLLCQKEANNCFRKQLGVKVEGTGSLCHFETQTMSSTDHQEVEATRSHQKISLNERANKATGGLSNWLLVASSSAASFNQIQVISTQITNAKLRSLQMASIQIKRPLFLASFICLLLIPFGFECQTNATNTPEPSNGFETSTTSEVTSSSFSETSFEPAVATDSQLNNSNNITKLKPVNFTLVDEIFDSVLSEEEVVRRWKFMDSQIQDGMKSILKMLFPQIVSLSQDAKVSGDCSGGILKWILSLRNLRSWAIKMLDATGKPTAGIFEGSLTMYGNYRQCLAIRAPDEDEIEITEQFEEYFRGQFCVIHLKPWMPVKKPFYHLNSTIDSLLRKNYKYYEKTLYDELAEIAIAFNFIDIRMDLCVPSTCTIADIQRVAELLSKKLEMRAKVMRCDIASRETNPLKHLDRYSYYWLPFPLILLTISLTATLLIALKIGTGSGDHKSEGDEIDERSAKRMNENKMATIIQCLSIGGAIRDRLSMPPGNLPLPKFGDERCQDQESSSGGQVAEPQVSMNLQRKPLPLYGLRNLFIFWFLIVQMTVELKYQYLRESLTLRSMIISYWPFQVIVNSSFLFESLILITAFTFSFTCLESTTKDLISYVVDKYIRLILSIITLIALTIVTPVISIESPVWRNFVEQQSNVCKATGYLDLLFLQNYISYDKICLPHTWLFCVEIQLIVLSIPLVLLLKKTFMSTEDSVIIDQTHSSHDKQTQTCLTRLTFCRLFKTKAGFLSLIILATGVFINFFTVYTNHLPPSWFYTFPDVEQKNYYFTKYLTKTWTHLSTFIIGLIGGHICRSTLQLRSVRSLKKNQFPQQRNGQQPSPVPSSSTSQSQLNSRQTSHGSTSTIMAMEQENGKTGENDKRNSSSAASSTSFNGEGIDSLEMKETRRFKSLVTVSSQLAAACCMSAIIFSTFSWSTQETPEPIVAALYDAGSRLLWSLALVGLMIQLCLPNEETGRYSTASRVFSHPLCTLMGRLSFLAYLISPYVHNFILAVEEQSLFPSLFLIFHVIVGNIVITYILAFILSIVIEQPLRRLISRFALGKRFQKQKINISTYYSSGTIQTISMPTKTVVN